AVLQPLSLLHAVFKWATWATTSAKFLSTRRCLIDPAWEGYPLSDVVDFLDPAVALLVVEVKLAMSSYLSPSDSSGSMPLASFSFALRSCSIATILSSHLLDLRMCFPRRS